MKRTCLYCLLSLLASPSVAYGQESEGIEDEFALLEEELSADEVESASKRRQSIFWSPSAITVFTREDMRGAAAFSLVDLLRRVPGFDVYDLKPIYPVMGARALTEDLSNLILLLVDGREALIEVAGFPLWAALPFDLDEVERIEVIRGPGSTLYGANAFAAVVNVTTVAEERGTRANVLFLGGENGKRQLSGRVKGDLDLGGGGLFYSVSLGTEGTYSPSDPKDAARQVFLRSHGYLRYQKGRALDLSLHCGFASAEGMMHMYVGDLRTTGIYDYFAMIRADLSPADWLELKTQMYYTAYHSTYHFRVPISSFGTWVANVPKFHAETPTLDGKVQADVRIREDLLVIAGVNLRYTHMQSDELIPSEIDETRGAGFVHAQWTPWSMLQLTGGLRLDFNTQTDPELSPRVVAVLRPWDQQAFRLGYALAFRKPSFVESRMHFRVTRYNPAFPEVVDKLAEQFGNENLSNERVHSIEAGWRGWFRGDTVRLSVDLFYNLYRDTIAFKTVMPLRMGLPDVAASTIQFVNEGTEADAIGGEAEVAWIPAPEWTCWLNASARLVTDSQTGETLPSEPKLRVNAGGRYRPADGLLFDLSLHYVSAYEGQVLDPEAPFEDPLGATMGNDFFLLALFGYRARLRTGASLEAGIALRSPLGPSFREFPGVPIPQGMDPDSYSNFGGEPITTRLSFYLRGEL